MPGFQYNSIMRLIIIRGIPGSGKTTLAKEYVAKGYLHYEADQYFERTGQYKFDSKELPNAHKWCMNQVLKAIESKRPVVVSNTFTRLWEMQPYIDMAKSAGIAVEVILATGKYKNVHGVPDDVVTKMADRFEHLTNT